MNVLRELRKVKKRSLPVRIILIIFFGSFLIMNTFAWYSVSRRIEPKGLGATVVPWDVEYYLNDSNVPLHESVTFTVNEIYPGMPEFEDYIYIRNTAVKSSKLEFKVKTITLLGELIYSSELIPEFTNQVVPNTVTTVIDANRDIESGNITIININEEYPFSITASYNKDFITGKYLSDEETPAATAVFTMNIEWDYELLENGLVSTNRDDLDTEFAKKAYKYYTENNNTNALVIEIELNANAV